MSFDGEVSIEGTSNATVRSKWGTIEVSIIDGWFYLNFRDECGNELFSLNGDMWDLTLESFQKLVKDY